MKLCIICLRTDKLLKLTSNLLEEFHDELCDFAVVTMNTSCYYCNECVYLLSKVYKFKEKCVKALKIYQEWMSRKASERQPIILLCTLLPPSPLGIWSTNPEKIATFTLKADSQTDMGIQYVLIKEIYTKEVKLEDDQNHNCNINKFADVLQTENISENVSDSHTDDINNKHIDLLLDENKEDEINSDNESIENTMKCENISETITKLKSKEHAIKKITAKKKAYDKFKEHDKDIVLLLENLDESDKESNVTTKYENISKTNTKLKSKEHPGKKITAKKKAYDKFKEHNKDINLLLENLDESDKESNVTTKYENVSGKITKTKSKDISIRIQRTKKKEYDKFKEHNKDIDLLHENLDESDKESIGTTKHKNVSEKITKLKSKECPSKQITTKNKAYDKVKENDKLYESIFEIEYLTTQAQKLEEFQRRKTYKCYTEAKHKCEICYQAFKSLNYLKYHTNKWHKESAGSVLCPLCKTWNSPISNHKSTHNVTFKCKLCPLVTYHRESMQNHFEQHKGIKYLCEQCNVTYKSKSAFRNHMGKVHRRGRNVCSGCGRGFRSPLGLNIHNKSSSRCTAGGAGAGGQGVRCDDCDVTLPSREVYAAHVFDVHAAPRAHGRPLTTDSAGLPERATLKSHEQKARKCIRHTPATHTCRVCNKSGVSFGWLQLHLKREHPGVNIDVLYADKRKHLCDICGAGFSNVYLLRDHIHKHTGALPHACDLCPKRFRSANLMREHRLRHFPSALPCERCGKRFKTKANLHSHMKVHTGEKNYKCDICGKAFLHSAAVKEHVRGVHHHIRRTKRGATRGGGAAKRKRMGLEADNDFDSDISE